MQNAPKRLQRKKEKNKITQSDTKCYETSSEAQRLDKDTLNNQNFFKNSETKYLWNIYKFTNYITHNDRHR